MHSKILLLNGKSAMLKTRSSRTYPIYLLICLLLSGCAQVGQEDRNPNAFGQDRTIAQQLDAALQRVNSQPRWSSNMDERASFASFATDSVSVSYQGSAADLLRAVASARGMSFRVTGATPHSPIFVFVAAVNEPFEQFIRDLDAQLGQRATIVWRDKGFELRYKH